MMTYYLGEVVQGFPVVMTVPPPLLLYGVLER